MRWPWVARYKLENALDSLALLRQVNSRMRKRLKRVTAEYLDMDQRLRALTAQIPAAPSPVASEPIRTVPTFASVIKAATLGVRNRPQDVYVAPGSN